MTEARQTESNPHPMQELAEFFASRGVDMTAHHAVFETILAASLLVSAMEERALRPFGLTHAGYRVLCEIWIKGPLAPRDLAAFMLVSRPSIVGTVDTLETAGFVARQRSTEDRRRVTVDLTPAGRSLVERADAAWHRCQVEVMSPLRKADQAKLAELGRQVASSAQRLRRMSPMNAAG